MADEAKRAQTPESDDEIDFPHPSADILRWTTAEWEEGSVRLAALAVGEVRQEHGKEVESRSVHAKSWNLNGTNGQACKKILVEKLQWVRWNYGHMQKPVEQTKKINPKRQQEKKLWKAWSNTRWRDRTEELLSRTAPRKLTNPRLCSLRILERFNSLFHHFLMETRDNCATLQKSEISC